ncbi:hypothetical protein ACE7GA_11675 [Roseomonas sp. CCTCC AB2023176]|uniref:hypothetical protein n=1 Tax=Roseomonas sp. CCTCC AB2023176 TaxID=3342640 RepID=UPI0035D5AC92
MTRITASGAALAGLLSLAACGTTTPNSPEAACRAEARDVPAVRDLARRMPPVGNVSQRETVEQEAGLAERRAYVQCMRARGLTPPGAGVEPERRP